MRYEINKLQYRFSFISRCSAIKNKLYLFILLVSLHCSLVTYSQCSKDSINFTWQLTNNCQPVSFTPSVTFGTGPYSYSWDFGDKSKSTDNSSPQPSHIYNDSAAGAVSYTVRLTVKDSKKHVCYIDSVITIQPTSVLMMDTTDVYNYTIPFVHCIPQGAPCSLTLKNKSTFQNSHYTIDWGDGSKFDSISFPPTLMHTYPRYNQYDVIATTPTGCISYSFFCGSSPAGGIGCPANRLSCVGVKLDFPVDAKTLENPQGTQYKISFHDGTKDLYYKQSNLPPIISHVYNGNTECISLSVDMTVTNPCGFTASSCYPVLVSTRPNPDYGFIRRVSDKDCANLTQYTFKNATSPCCVKPDGSKDNAVKLNWSFTPNSYKILNGGLDSNEVTIVFLNRLCYTVKLNVQYMNHNCSRCGDTNITKVLCMDSLPIAKAQASALNNFSNCSLPFTIDFTNLSFNAKTYLWKVFPKTTNPFWSVSFAKGTDKYSTNPSIKFEQPDTFNVVLNAINNCGASFDTVQIKIVSSPIVKMNKPMVFCGPDSFNLKIDTNNVLFSNVNFYSRYFWTISPSTGVNVTSSSSQYPQFYFNSNHLKTYNLKISLDNHNGCPPVIDSTTIEFTDKPNLVAGSNKLTVCKQDSILLSVVDNSINHGKNIIYRWYQPDSLGGLVDTIGSRVIAMPGKTTTYSVKGYMASNPICQDIATITINVIALPAVKISPLDTTVCKGDSVIINAAGGVSYSWSPVNSSASSIKVAPSVKTVYTVIVTGINGCKNRISSVVNVNPLPDVSFTNKAIEFVNTDVTFLNTSSNTNSFTWDFGDGGNTNDQFPIYKYTATGTYNIILTGIGDNGCTNQTVNKIKIIKNIPFSLKGDSGCSPVTINFINNVIDPELKFLWKFGYNNLSSNSPNPGPVTFTSDKDAIFFVTLFIVYNNDTITSTVKVHVFNKPIANFTVNPRCGCPILNVKITNFSQSALPYSSQWIFGNGNSAYEPIFTSHKTYQVNYKGIPADSSYYTITLTDSNKCGTSTTSNLITVFPDNIIVQFTPDKTDICVNDIVSFTNQSQFYTSLFWDFGDSSKSADINPQHAFNKAGVFTVKLTAFNQCIACGGKTVSSSSSFSVPITVHALPALDFRISNKYLCSEEPVLFSNTSKDPLSALQWNFGDPRSGAANFSNYMNPSHTYKLPATYTVTFIGRSLSANPCVDTIKKPVVINVKPTALFSDTNFCQSIDGQFFNKSLNYQKSFWFFGDGGFSNDINPIHHFTNPGDFSVKLIAINNNGCTDTTKSIITIYPDPYANFDYFSLNRDNNQMLVSFNNLSSDTCNYFWDFGDGTSSTETNPQHIYNNIATYEVKLVVTNIYDCTSEADKVIYPEQPKYYFYVPNAFTPGSVINSTFRPVVTYFLSYHLKIFNRWGELLFETTDYNNPWDGSYMRNPCPDGTYVYVIQVRDATSLAEMHTYNGYVVLLRKK
jgi:gliding motility-associated-like protein